MTDLLNFTAEALFLVLFLVALVQYARQRDPVSRALVLVFSALSVLILASVWAAVTGEAPVVLSVIGVGLFIGQPLFTLHLVSLVRPVSRRLFVGSSALLLGTAVPLVLLQASLDERVAAVLTLVVFAVFAGIEAVAAVLLLIEGRRRRGPGATRMILAAAGTGLFAATILVAIAGAAVQEIGPVASGLALLAGLLYLIAFLPPAPVRRIWQAATAVRFLEELLADAGATVEEIWDRFARTAATATGGVATVIIATGDHARIVAATGLPDEVAVPSASRDDLDDLIRGESSAERPIARVPKLASEIAALHGGRYATVVTIDPPTGGTPAVLVLSSSHRSLFQNSDIDLLATLGTQAALVAERRAVLAEQEALATQLAATVEALHDASRAKSDFLASMSHELRTPLSAILGFSDLMRREERDGDNVSVPVEWIEHVHRGGEHLLSLINEVLDLARVEAGRLDLNLESIDIGLAVSESVNGLRPLAERKAIELAAAGPSATVMADRGRLRQILYNLLSNAIKYTPEGGSVRVETSSTPDEARMSVVDTGVGISEDDQRVVFEEFRQVGDPAERQPGAGLGLALTRRLVEAHHGRIELESARGTGSRFTVVLPLAAAGARKDAQLPAVPAAEPTVRDGLPADDDELPAAAPLVLVIEDDPSATRLLREYLEPAGFRVSAAPDGDAGIEAARRLRPAAIVLDILLPRMDGWEVLRQLKAEPSTGSIPVIIVTVVDERDIGLALGAVDYLVKPIERDAILATLARMTLTAKVREREVRVLAVDDDPTALELIRAALEPDGFTVVLAGGGREALERVREGPVDAIVCDLVMPEVDGFEVVATLKGDPTTAAIPIIVCTGHDLTPAQKAFLNGKILGIVAKGTAARDGLRGWLTTAVSAGVGDDR